MHPLILLVDGFDPVPNVTPVVLATYTRNRDTVELLRYPGCYSVRTLQDDQPTSEEVFTCSETASLAYNQATDNVWADWYGELEDMARDARDQRLENLACAIDML